MNEEETLERKIIKVLCNYNDMISEYETELDKVTELVIFTESLENVLYIMAEHDVETEFVDKVLEEGAGIIDNIIKSLRKGE